MPVIEYAREMNAPYEKLLRALIVSNLISIHQKRFLGSLSAYCGATSAACGAVCGVAYLYGYGYDAIANTITNTIANIGGMFRQLHSPALPSGALPCRNIFLWQQAYTCQRFPRQ